MLIADGGRVPLNVRDLRVTGDGFEAPAGPLQIAAGATVQFPVTFRPPAAGAYAGTLTFSTDDGDLPSVAIQLEGRGTLAGGLGVTPAALDFGRVGEGQTATRPLTLFSRGPADLYLGALGLAPGTPDAFAWVGSIRVPATLAAGSGAVLGVRFSPTPQTASASGALVVESSDPGRPRLEIPVTATINRAPVAIVRGSAGGAAVTGALDAAVGATVLLDGSGSFDPDGDLPLAFAWSLAARPDGSAAVIGSPSAPQATLRLDAAGIYPVLLTASDSTGLPSFTPGRLDIRALPGQGLTVELVWDQIAPDLDLHFLAPGAALQSAGDCSWTNPDPSWGPHHLGDKLTGYGPETVVWDAPAQGTWSVQVVYANAHGAQNPATNAQVRVYLQGVLVADLGHAFSRQGEIWTAGTVDWPSGRIGVTP